MRIPITKTIVFLSTLIPISCARVTMPEGGPKDIIKPELVESKSSPKNNQRNFREKQIQLYFTENIKLKDPKEEILITPSPGKDVKYEAIANKLIITPKTNWQENTTYNVQFRESIQDVTESNPAEDLHLAFSTGETIDSLSIKGFVKNTKTETIPEKITVALYTADTFDIFKHTPNYFTKTNKLGQFQINNLKQGKYFIYAFDDKNKNLKVESVNEKYGFKTNPVVSTTNGDSISLNLANIDTRPIKLNTNRSTNKTTILRFNKNLTSYALSNIGNRTHTFGDNQTEIIVYHDPEKITKDSVNIRIEATDSLYQKYDSMLYIKQGESKGIKQSFSISTEEPSLNFETGDFELKGKTNLPIAAINLDSLTISLDSTKQIKFKPEQIRIEPTTKKFTISTKIDTAELTVKHQTDGGPAKTKRTKKITRKILLGKGLFRSINNDSSKRQTILLPEKQTNNTGSLQIKVTTLEPNYVIELLDSQDKVIEKITNKKNHQFKNLKAQEYKIKITIDKNKNQKWDIGNYTIREEPEPVYYYRGLKGKTSIAIRENFDVGPIEIKF